MHEAHYQAVLFESAEPKPSHLHYGTWSPVPEVKVGMTAVGVGNRMKRDGQFKGHSVIFQRPAAADCEVHIVNGRKVCDWERNWQQAHAHDRIPGTEKYRVTEDVVTALSFMVKDAKGRAAIEWMRQHGMGRTA